MVTYRKEEKRPLTCDEVDGNFRELANWIADLKKAPADAEAIAMVEQRGGVLHFQGTRGSSLGAVELPQLCWNARGMWKPNTLYAFLDVVFVEDSLYVCKEAHTSSKQFIVGKLWRHLFTFRRPDTGSLALPKPSSQPQVSQMLGTPQISTVQPVGKEDLPKDPPVGTLILIVDAPDQPDLFYWNGKDWVRVRDGRFLSVL